MEHLAANIRAERSRKRLTQAELAAAAGLSPTYLHRIERGRAQPTVGRVQDLADALGVPISALVERHTYSVTEPTA
jgi:transcriptional regulator with XRE-family HTH domain